VAELRHHRHQQARLRLAGAQPATVTLRFIQLGQPPARWSWTWCSGPNAAPHSTPTTPAAASPSSLKVSGCTHMLRHALASAMATNKEPASIIAAQLRHADGGALAQRVYIHQLPQTPPRVTGLIEGVFGPAARDERSASAERRAERNRSEPGPAGLRDWARIVTMSALVVALVAGPGFEPG
jgi:hypothetical protein